MIKEDVVKLKELEEWLANHIGHLKHIHKFLLFGWLKRENTIRISCYTNILDQLQSLIKEAQDES